MALSHCTAKFFTKNPESKLAQVDAWTMGLNNAFDVRVRKSAIRRIQALGGKVFITSEGELKVKLPK